MNYLEDIPIDESSLDIEWLEQSELAVRYGLNWSNLQSELERAEEHLKVTENELLLEISKNPEKYLGDEVKVTDPKIKASVYLQDEYKEAKEDVLNAKKKVRDAEVAKNEISYTRKSALENLVVLHGQNYFAGPRMPRDLKAEVEERRKRTEQADKKVKRLKRRK